MPLQTFRAPSPNETTRLYLMPNGNVVASSPGVAHDAAAPIGRTTLAPPFTAPKPTIDADPDPDPTNGAPDAISALMQFLADKLEAPDLQQAQTLIEQALSDTSTTHTNGAGNPASGMSMDAASRARRASQRAAEAKGFTQRWPGASRVRVVG